MSNVNSTKPKETKSLTNKEIFCEERRQNFM
jgi:hypothetical protein